MQSEPIRILAVDDIRENLVALEAGLDQPGVELVTARSGMEALELLLRQDFALALLDVQMPEMDGFELAELMRGTERTRGVPIIFLTAVATDERRRFRGFEAGAVDYMLKPLDLHVLNSKVAVFVELARQRQEIARQRDELGMALSRTRAHGDNSPLAVLEIDESLRIVRWAKSAERLLGFTEADMLGLHLAEAPFLRSEDRSTITGRFRALMGPHSDRTRIDQHILRADGKDRLGEWYCSSLPPTGSRPASVTVAMLDVTERHEAEQTQRLLIGELNHRVKNTLATVQAIASQGLRHASGLSDFHEAFNGRLQALARAHSSLSDTTWAPASLRNLIADQVAIGALGEDRLHLSGPDIDMPPEVALRFALILHELTTNAHKYGALSNDSGIVHLDWSLESGALHLVWRESGGPQISQPERRGFGSTLIERSMASDGARIEAQFLPSGVVWTMHLPLPEIASAAAIAPLASAAPAIPALPAMPAIPHPAPSPVSCSTEGIVVLVVEDEPLVAMELTMEIEDHGGIAIGPASSCEQALSMIAARPPMVALLDGNLNGERVDIVADKLAQAGTPFAFVSGYNRDHLPEAHRDRPMLGKPFLPADVRAMLQQLAAECTEKVA
ncbi:response regulator [Novosphingobium sp. 9]|uniref:response regulator n=1 Tax=Novosphingobium sp. 9 TaxID=2025349 RepID=UPI0021B54DAF|nr:response regulator [Novosphingobium sp. 9]